MCKHKASQNKAQISVHSAHSTSSQYKNKSFQTGRDGLYILGVWRVNNNKSYSNFETTTNEMFVKNFSGGPNMLYVCCETPLALKTYGLGPIAAGTLIMTAQH